MNSVTHSFGSRRQFLTLTAAAAAAAAVPAFAQQEETNQTSATFDEVWRTVRDHFYDPHFAGLDWQAVRDRYLPQAVRASSVQQSAEVINAMLAELHASHTQFYTRDEPEYYQLAAIFAPALKHRGTLEKAFPGGRISYPGIGILTHAGANGEAVIGGAIDGAPGSQAGLLAGDAILSVDGAPFRPVAAFRDKIGKPVALQIRRAGALQRVEVTPAELEPAKMFLDGLNDSARIIPANGRRIGYVHIWNYAGHAYQEALETLLSEGKLKDADALIWDLREGWGGAVPEYLDLFNPRAPTLQMTGRDGKPEIDNFKWRKPVAMLINGRTRSGKEILAFGFKKYQLGEVIGQRTEGAVLAATAFLIGDGLLLLAVEDVRVDDQRLEGVGVTPTIEVLPSEGGADTQLDRAVEVLAKA